MKTIVLLSFLLLSPMSYSADSLAPSLNGIWLRSCAKGALQLQIFEGAQSSTHELFFEDLGCTNPVMAFITEGRNVFQDVKVDFSYESVELVLYSEQLIEDYNQRKVCGKKDWKKNSKTVITGLQCALFQKQNIVQVPKADDLRYGIWKIENQKLYFGQLTRAEDGSSPEKRPSTWDPNPYFKQR